MGIGSELFAPGALSRGEFAKGDYNSYSQAVLAKGDVPLGSLAFGVLDQPVWQPAENVAEALAVGTAAVPAGVLAAPGVVGAAQTTIPIARGVALEVATHPWVVDRVFSFAITIGRQGWLTMGGQALRNYQSCGNPFWC